MHSNRVLGSLTPKNPATSSWSSKPTPTLYNYSPILMMCWSSVDHIHKLSTYRTDITLSPTNRHESHLLCGDSVTYANCGIFGRPCCITREFMCAIARDMLHARCAGGITALRPTVPGATPPQFRMVTRWIRPSRTRWTLPWMSMSVAVFAASATSTGPTPITMVE